MDHMPVVAMQVLPTAMFVVAVAMLALILLAFVVLLFGVVRYARLWFQCWQSRAPVSIWQIVGMRRRRVDPGKVCGARILAAQAGLPLDGPNGVTLSRLEECYLAGIDVEQWVQEMIAEHTAG